MGVLCQEMENKIPMLCAQLSVFAGRVPQTYNHVITANNTVFTEDTTVRASWLQVIRRSLVPVPKVSAKATAQAELNQECSKGGKDKGKGKEPRSSVDPWCLCRRSLQRPLRRRSSTRSAARAARTRARAKSPGKGKPWAPADTELNQKGSKGKKGMGMDKGKDKGQEPKAKGQPWAPTDTELNQEGSKGKASS
eukprot:s1003_g12.t1